MTLVLTAACRDHVFLVADRRLTLYPSGRLQDDDRNKVTVYDNRLAFGYSGLAEIGGKRTDIWLAEQLSRIPNPILQTLAERATDAWQALSPRLPAKSRRHAFVMVGWGRDETRRRVPVLATVSNALAPSGAWLETANPTFTVDQYLLMPRHRWGIFHPIGAALRPGELADLHRRIRPALKRTTRPLPAVLEMGETIRRVAARDGTVGSSLVGVVLPIPDPDRDHRHFGVPFLPSAGALAGPKAFDLSAGGDDFRWVPPNLVYRRQLMTHGTIEAVGGRLTRMEMRISKPPPGYQAGIALVGQNEGVFFGMDENGKPFIIERKGGVTRLVPLAVHPEDPPP